MVEFKCTDGSDLSNEIYSQMTSWANLVAPNPSLRWTPLQLIFAAKSGAINLAMAVLINSFIFAALICNNWVAWRIIKTLSLWRLPVSYIPPDFEVSLPGSSSGRRCALEEDIHWPVVLSAHIATPIGFATNVAVGYIAAQDGLPFNRKTNRLTD